MRWRRIYMLHPQYQRNMAVIWPQYGSIVLLDMPAMFQSEERLKPTAAMVGQWP